MQKKTSKKKSIKRKAAGSRSQKVNKPAEPSPEARAAGKKVICFNMECRLRRAGCYGYEACPGYKSKD